MSEHRSREQASKSELSQHPTSSCLTDQIECVYHYSSRTIDRSFLCTPIIRVHFETPAPIIIPLHIFSHRHLPRETQGRTPGTDNKRECPSLRSTATPCNTTSYSNPPQQQQQNTTTTRSHSAEQEQRHPARLDSLCKLLLDKEGPQVRQLPGTRHAQHGQLDQDPAHHAAVGALGLVAELGLAFLFVGSQ